MIKKIIVFGLFIISSISVAQESSSSPYSYFGIGELKFRGTEEAKSMGGLAIVGDSINLNLTNPASYSHLRLTTFTVGGSSTFGNIQNDELKEKVKRTSLDYIAVGIPMGKFGAAIGLMPYSSVGYRITGDSYIGNTNIPSTKRFSGNGSINRVFVGTAYNFSKNLSFGLNIEYNFGNLESEVAETSNELQLGTRELNTAQVKGTTFNFGLLYNRMLNDKLKLYSSLHYIPESKLSSTNTRNVAVLTYSVSSGAELISDSQDVAVPNSKIVVPSKFALGFGVGQANKWMLGTEVSFIGTKKMTNVFANDVTNATYKNAQRYIIGGYYIPKFDSYSSYFSRVVYRAGFRYEKTGLNIENQDINDYGMNFGFGLPVGISKIDLGFEFGKRGTTSNGLIQENYFNINIGLSLSDKWFRKTLID